MSHIISVEEFEECVVENILASDSETRKRLILRTSIFFSGGIESITPISRFVIKVRDEIVFSDESLKSAVSKYNSIWMMDESQVTFLRFLGDLFNMEEITSGRLSRGE